MLGPLLWNLGYNKVLSEANLSTGCVTVCYADDTIVLAAGDDWNEAKARMDDTLGEVLAKINSLGLRVAPSKLEAVCFRGGRKRGAPPNATVCVGGARITVGPRIKYLGLTLDERWAFVDFAALAPRLSAVTGQCSRLMPNLGGPGGTARRLFATVVHSVALYGAPVWSGVAQRSRRIKLILNRAQRTMAIRAIRGYRTVSHAAATLLAGYPPLDLVAGMQARVYHEVRRLRLERHTNPSLREEARIRREATQALMREWREWTEDPSINGYRVVEALAPWLEEWSQRSRGHLSFRAVQVMTGHGSFGQYLHRIGRDHTPVCWHCDAAVDSAQHTLAECQAWTEERRALTSKIGGDLALPGVVGTILGNEEVWKAFIKFCDVVMLKKEDAERARRGEVPRAVLDQGGDSHGRRGGLGRGAAHRRGGGAVVGNHGGRGSTQGRTRRE